MADALKRLPLYDLMSDDLEDRFLRYRTQAATVASGIVVLSSGILFALKERLPEIRK